MSIELRAARLERPLTDREDGGAAGRLLPQERRERLQRLTQPDEAPGAPVRLSVSCAGPCGSGTAGGTCRRSASASFGKPYFPDSPGRPLQPQPHRGRGAGGPVGPAGGGGHRAHPPGEPAGHAPPGGRGAPERGVLPELGPAGGPGQAQRNRRGRHARRRGAPASPGSSSTCWRPSPAMWPAWPPGAAVLRARCGNTPFEGRRRGPTKRGRLYTAARIFPDFRGLMYF